MADQTLRPRPSDRCSCTSRINCGCAGTTMDRCPCFGHLLQSDEPAGVERSALWDLLKRAVRMYRSEIEHYKLVAELLAKRTSERDEARAELKRSERLLVTRTGERDTYRAEAKLWQKRAEMGDVRGDLAKLEFERDTLVIHRDHWRKVAENRSAHIQELVEQREKHWAELEQLREDLAHARNQEQGTPVSGQPVVLRLEDGKTVTGLLMDHGGRRIVNGWLVDVPGRSLVGVQYGGRDR